MTQASSSPGLVPLMRRMVRRGLTAAALLAALAAPAQAGSLPWKSGVACSGAEFGAWRGQKVDMAIGFAPWRTWSSMVAYFAKGGASRVKKRGTNASFGVGLLTSESAGRFTDCAAGRFDAHFRAIGQNLARQGMGNADIRLGWEANGHGWPWSIGDQVEPYKACFRRAVTALRSGAPGLSISWHMAKRGKLRGPVTAAFPGAPYVTNVAMSFYDDEAAKHGREMHNGGPWGLEAWLAFAKSQGKKFAVSEWGVGRKGDNKAFIEKTFDFFRKNASSIAYEAYFNCPHSNGIYLLHPTRRNPQSSARYLQLYKAGG